MNIYIKYIVPIFLFVLIIFGALECLSNNKRVIDFFNENRPAYTDIPLSIHVEKQVWLYRSKFHEYSRGGKILLVGSSSVVNGLDPEIVKEKLKKEGIDQEPYNMGLTGFMAYELLMLKDFYLSSDVKTIVYFYNAFSFPNVFHPDAVRVRWSTKSFFWLKPGFIERLQSYAVLKDGGIGEISQYLRFKDFLSIMIRKFIFFDLKPIPYSWDYSPDRLGISEKVSRDPVPPASPKMWLRKAYVESSSDVNSMGYLALSHFCDLAKKSNKRLIIMPAPEADFGFFADAYAVGVNRDFTDTNVQNIARKCGAEYIYTSAQKGISAEDTLFLDSVHLSQKGRNKYSDLVGGILAERLKSDRPIKEGHR